MIRNSSSVDEIPNHFKNGRVKWYNETENNRKYNLSFDPSQSGKNQLSSKI